MIMNEKQSEVLRITQEECAEVVQAISKIFRFGIDEVYEGQTNKQRLASELGDLQCMINLVKQFGVVTEEEIYRAELHKRNRLGMWSNIFDKEEVIQ
jgi:NTP pyrophosphatase (non-canonical NTP hydrolase)